MWGAHVDSPEEWTFTEYDGVKEFEGIGDHFYYGFPVGCAYFPHDLRWWTEQTNAYALKCNSSAPTGFLRRFLLVAKSNLKYCYESLSKSPAVSQGLTAYQKTLVLLHERLTQTYIEEGNARKTCLALLWQPIASISDLFYVLDVYHHNGLFSKVVDACLLCRSNPQCPKSIKAILKVKMFDAYLHVLDRVLDPQVLVNQIVNNLDHILRGFGKVETLKATIGVYNQGPLVALLSKKSVSFLKTCFEICIGSRPLEDLLDDLSSHISHTNDYFLRIRLTLGGNILVASNAHKTYIPQVKAVYEQSIIARVLEVITHIGYATLGEETKQTLLNLLKPAFSRLVAPEVEETLETNPWDKTILKQTLLRYDILLLKIFKGDQEAAQNYQKIRLLLGIDLSEKKEMEID